MNHDRRPVATRFRALLAAVALLAGAAAARAGELDQEFFRGSGSFGANIDRTQSLAQTFTVGRAGFLDRVELQIWRAANATEPLVVELRRTSGAGVPDAGEAALLASLTVQPSEVGTAFFPTTLTGFDLGGQAFPVAPGDRLAIALRSSAVHSAEQWYSWTTDTNGGYGGGYAASGPPYSGDAGADRGFRTFVAIPEPAAPALVVAAAAACLGRRRAPVAAVFWA